MKQIRVPDGMLEAVKERYPFDNFNEIACRSELEAALLWLSENPIVPTREQTKEILAYVLKVGIGQTAEFTEESLSKFCIEWQRRMFLAEPEIPEEIDALLAKPLYNDNTPPFRFE